jgi:hypothetical protein
MSFQKEVVEQKQQGKRPAIELVKRAGRAKTSCTSRQRLIQTLNHRQPDRLCVDFGAGGQTGMGAGAVYRLRKALLGESDFRVKIIEPYQMLGEIDDALKQALQVDVAGINPPVNMFGFKDEGFKPYDMPDGTPVLVPEKFNPTVDSDGNILMYAEGDTAFGPCAKMPKNGCFFDAINRQQPLCDETLDPADNCQEFRLLSPDEVRYFADKAADLSQNTDYGVYLTLPGTAFGDIALVPATFLKNPRGIRDVEEWYISIAMRRPYIHQVFETQCQIALKNIEMLAEAVGDHAQVVFASGTDFGTQRGPFISKQCYRDLYMPYHKAINDKIHELTNWKIFMHSCGAVSELIPDFIEAGFDILNPVQCSAEGMSPEFLKNEFGRQLVFWGGGIDTQRTLPFGTPQQVYEEVSRRIEIFAAGGGFVFNSIHNIQSHVPTENILAMLRALDDARI